MMLLNVYQRNNLFLVEGCLGNWLLCVIFGSTGICSHFLSIVPICIHIYQCHPHPLTPPQPTPLFRLPPGSTFCESRVFSPVPQKRFWGQSEPKTRPYFMGMIYVTVSGMYIYGLSDSLCLHMEFSFTGV